MRKLQFSRPGGKDRGCILLTARRPRGYTQRMTKHSLPAYYAYAYYWVSRNAGSPGGRRRG